MSLPPVYTIQGREVRFPVQVRDACSGAASFVVDARAARLLIPSDFRVVEFLPGRTLLSFAAIDYRDNDLGNYHEVSLAFFVRPPGEPPGLPYLGAWAGFLGQRIGTYIHRLPVDQSFTCEAGVRIWGFPKTVDDLEIRRGDGRCTCTWSRDGRRVLALSLACGGRRTLAEREMVTYSLIQGVPHATRFTTAAEGFGVRPGGARLELGDHPICDELRALGLPRRALLTTWMERMHGRFDPPHKL